MAGHARRNPIYAADIRQLGGVVNVHTARDRCGEGPLFRVSYLSRGGDLAFLSNGTPVEDHALASARLLAEFLGATAIGEISPIKQPSKFRRLQPDREMPLANPRP